MPRIKSNYKFSHVSFTIFPHGEIEATIQALKEKAGKEARKDLYDVTAEDIQKCMEKTMFQYGARAIWPPKGALSPVPNAILQSEHRLTDEQERLFAAYVESKHGYFGTVAEFQYNKDEADDLVEGIEKELDGLLPEGGIPQEKKEAVIGLCRNYLQDAEVRGIKATPRLQFMKEEDEAEGDSVKRYCPKKNAGRD